ncbi:hypothetical protein PENTCL1PPCAC_11955, partial [Pristionchus entomophagus]
ERVFLHSRLLGNHHCSRLGQLQPFEQRENADEITRGFREEEEYRGCGKRMKLLRNSFHIGIKVIIPVFFINRYFVIG